MHPSICKLYTFIAICVCVCLYALRYTVVLQYVHLNTYKNIKLNNLIFSSYTHTKGIILWILQNYWLRDWYQFTLSNCNRKQTGGWNQNVFLFNGKKKKKYCFSACQMPPINLWLRGSQVQLEKILDPKVRKPWFKCLFPGASTRLFVS